MQITRKLIVSNTVWSAFAQGSVMLINLLVLPLFITNLGADLYGIWVLSNVVLGYLNVFDLGFTQGLQKYVAEARVKENCRELSEVVVTGFGLLVMIGVFLAMLVYREASAVVAFFNIQVDQQAIAIELLQISAIFCVVMWPLRIVDVVLSATLRIKELSFLTAFKNIAQSVTMLVMILCAYDVIVIKWATSVVLFASSLYGVILLKRYMPEVVWRPLNFKFGQLLRMQRFSLGMFYAGLIGLLHIQIDTLIIGKFLSMSAVTAYVIAAKPFQMVQQIGGLLMRAVTPASYTLGAQQDLERLASLVTLGVRGRSLVVMPICFVAFACITDFILLWVGEDYFSAIIWAQVFLLVPILGCLGVGAHVCKGVGEVGLVNNFTTAKIALNLVTSIMLIPHFGIGGPILGTVISSIVLGDVVALQVYCRRVGVPSRGAYGFFARVLAVSIVAFLISYFALLLLASREPSYVTFLIKVTVAILTQVACHLLFSLTQLEQKKIIVYVKGLFIV